MVLSRHLKSVELSDLGFELVIQISWLPDLHKIFSRFKAHHVNVAA